MKDLVSVIIPVYNTEIYLKECLDSVLNNSYKNIEIVIIDDGSTDNSKNIIKQYENLYKSKIKAIYSSNNGVSVARNKALDIATGEYIIFVDSDDYINSNLIEIFLREIKINDCDIVFCNFYSFINNKPKKDILYKQIKENKILGSLLENSNILEYNIDTVTSKIYKKSVIGKTRFVPNMMYEDVYFSQQTILNANKIKAIKDYLYYYRIHQNSNVGLNDDRTLDRLKSAKLILKLYKDNFNKIKHIDLDYLYNKLLTSAILISAVNLASNKKYDIKEKLEINKTIVNFCNENFENWKNNKYVPSIIRSYSKRMIDNEKRLLLWWKLSSGNYNKLRETKISYLIKNIIILYIIMFLYYPKNK